MFTSKKETLRDMGNLLGGGGGSGKQARSQGGLQKGPFLATKWAKNCVILVGLGLGP